MIRQPVWSDFGRRESLATHTCCICVGHQMGGTREAGLRCDLAGVEGTAVLWVVAGPKPFERCAAGETPAHFRTAPLGVRFWGVKNLIFENLSRKCLVLNM